MPRTLTSPDKTNVIERPATTTTTTTTSTKTTTFARNHRSFLPTRCGGAQSRITRVKSPLPALISMSRSAAIIYLEIELRREDDPARERARTFIYAHTISLEDGLSHLHPLTCASGWRASLRLIALVPPRKVENTGRTTARMRSEWKILYRCIGQRVAVRQSDEYHDDFINMEGSMSGRFDAVQVERKFWLQRKRRSRDFLSQSRAAFSTRHPIPMGFHRAVVINRKALLLPVPRRRCRRPRVGVSAT